MAKGPQYNLPFRRRREGRTHYGKRRRLVSSGKARLVVRASNKHLIAQIIEAGLEGDRIVASAHSSELKKFGWKAPFGNLPAAYLTGLLAGRRAKSKGIPEAILDIGLHSRGAGTRIFAAAKGAVDGGLTVPHDKTALPDMQRIKGQHIVEYSKLLSAQAETYRKKFSDYLKNKLKPEELTEHFTEIEEKITSTIG